MDGGFDHQDVVGPCREEVAPIKGETFWKAS